MRTRVALAATIATAAAAGALLGPASAGAVTRYPKCDPDCRILVNSTVDAPDANPGDGRCATTARKCTLRAAVQEANALRNKPPFQSKILVPPGNYVLTRHGLDDTGDRGDLDLHFVGAIVGAGQSRTIVDGDAADRVFDMHSDGENLISHLTVRNGSATDGPGGGIRSTSFPNYLSYLFVTDNEAVPGEATDSGKGGGIAGSDLTVTDTYVAYNDAQDGAGMWQHGAEITFGRDTFRGNHATRNGGGLLYDIDDTYVTNLTISGNRADGHGGGVYITDRVPFASFTAATIASNSAPSDSGGGIWSEKPTSGSEFEYAVAGLIVARSGGGDCGGPAALTSMGGNLDSDETCGFGQASDKSGIDPALGPVAYNGGPTPTRALDPASPAVDMWDCNNGGFPHPLTVDQRGAARPQQETCDAGAFEVGLCCPAQEPPFVPGSNEDPSTPVVGDCGVIRQGTLGNDTLVGNDRRNEIHGRDGGDRIFGVGNADCLFGGKGRDHIQGGEGTDTIYGGPDNDHLIGGLGEDFIQGGLGRDRIEGGADEDRLYGGSGPDVISGGDGYDKITAGPGDDTIDATGRGLDAVDCGSGEDTVKAKRLEHLYRCEHVKYVD